MDGEHAVTYPPMADNHSLVKDWEESLLQNCSKERMQTIARQYSLPNTTTLTKEPLYHAVVSHMQTIRDCVECGGTVSYTHLTLPTKRIV